MEVWEAQLMPGQLELDRRTRAVALHCTDISGREEKRADRYLQGASMGIGLVVEMVDFV